MISNAGQLGIHLDPFKMDWTPTPECPIGLLTIQGWAEKAMEEFPDPPDLKGNKGGETYASSVGKRPVGWDKQ